MPSIFPGGLTQEIPAVRPFDEAGVSGLLRTKGVGYVYEEWLASLSGLRQRQIYRQMRDNDAVIGALFYALEMILRKADWYVEAATGNSKAEEYAKFIEQCMEDMCYDDQTEILAKRGWVLFEDLMADDLVAQREADGELRYVKPTKIHEFDYDGELLGNCGDSVDFLVTPSHRMLFAPRTGRAHDSSQKDGLGIHECADIYNKSGWLSKEAKWAGTPCGRGADWLEFLGFFVADGCASGKAVVLIQKEKEYVEDLLLRAGLRDRATTRAVNGSTQWIINDAAMTREFQADFGIGSRNKSLPQWLKDAPPDEIRSFLKGFYEGDGSLTETGLIALYTSSRRLADDLQEVAIKAGYATTLLTREGSATSFSPGTENFRVSIWVREEALRPYLKCGRNWYKQPYQGKVHCVSVPSGVIMVRRNGKPMWCGNSHTWEDFIAECVNMFAFGFSLFETVYKRRQGPNGKKASRFDDGLIGWRKFAPRAQESILYWMWDDEGGLQGAVQLAAPDYATVPMPIGKLLLIRTTSIKNNPEGRSILRNVFRAWTLKTRDEEVEGIGLERDLCGMPVIYASQAAIKEMGGMDAVRRMIRNVRVDDQYGLILPQAFDERGNPYVKFELVKAAGRKSVDAGTIIKRHNEDILNSALAGFIGFGQTEHGARSMHISATQIFGRALESSMDAVAAVVNRIAIPRLMALNKMDLGLAPKLLPGEIQGRDLEELGNYVQKLSAAGLTFFDKDTATVLRKKADLPEQPEDTTASASVDVDDDSDSAGGLPTAGRKPVRRPPATGAVAGQPLASSKPMAAANAAAAQNVNDQASA